MKQHHVDHSSQQSRDIKINKSNAPPILSVSLLPSAYVPSRIGESGPPDNLLPACSEQCESMARQAPDSLEAAAQATVHEVRQPLVGVITNAGAALNWLAHSPPNLEESRDALNRVIRDGLRAGDILERIHGLFAGAPTERTSTDLNLAVSEALISAQSSVRQGGVTVICDLDASLPEVLGDRVQLEQCLFNLITNAVEALATVRDRPRRLKIRSFIVDPACVAIEVIDTGPGFPPAIMERMFDPVFSTKASGMGVGLSICRLIAQAHGGQVVAAAGQPYGAVFRLTLPSIAETAA